MKDRRAHWERLYTTRPITHVGWYRPHLDTSLAFIQALDLPRSARILDVGGGASTLVDDLLALGFEAITVLDLSAAALDQARARLGERAERITWVTADITEVSLPAAAYDLWHDRAVFHFLTAPEERARYLEQLRTALRPGGFVILATFAPEAPPTCSGLPVVRYDLDTLVRTIGPGFRLVRHGREHHVTPGGVEQPYLYACFQRDAGSRP